MWPSQLDPCLGCLDGFTEKTGWSECKNTPGQKKGGREILAIIQVMQVKLLWHCFCSLFHKALALAM
jgi:hypothetical protein